MEFAESRVKVNGKPKVWSRADLGQSWWLFLRPITNVVILISVAALAFWSTNDLKATQYLTIPFTLVMGNFVVWLIHKYPLHRKIKHLEYAYEVHACRHHMIYTHQDIELHRFKEFPNIVFHSYVVIGFGVIFSPILYGLIRVIIGHNIAAMMVGLSASYFLFYELMHTCAHLPKKTWIFKIPFFRYMREHHRIHHNPKLMRHKNFGIALPIADWILGTLHMDADDTECS